MDISTREVALLIWFAAFALWAASHQSIRKAFCQALKGAANKTIITFLAFLVAYTLAELWVVHSLGLWRPELIKTALGWFILTGLTTGVNAVTAYDDPPYGKHVKDSLQIAVILGVVMGKFTFSLPVELVLIPVVVFLGVMATVNEIHVKDAMMQRFLYRIQVLLGLLIFAVVAVRAVTQLSVLASPVVLMELLLPPMLSLLFIPAVFLLVLFIRYEWLFKKLQGDKNFRRHARLRLLRLLGPKPRKVLAFGRKHAFVLPSVRTRADLEELIRGRLSTV